jgi:hypothetical protein
LCVNCTRCDAGYYSSSQGAVSSATCLQCPSGTYSVIKGLTTADQCTKCQAGTYSQVPAQNSPLACIACPEGTFSQAVGANTNTTCSPCGSGRWSSVQGATECSLCPSGTYSTRVGQASNGTCELCQPGWFLVYVCEQQAGTHDGFCCRNVVRHGRRQQPQHLFEVRTRKVLGGVWSLARKHVHELRQGALRQRDRAWFRAAVPKVSHGENVLEFICLTQRLIGFGCCRERSWIQRATTTCLTASTALPARSPTPWVQRNGRRALLARLGLTLTWRGPTRARSAQLASPPLDPLLPTHSRVCAAG